LDSQVLGFLGLPKISTGVIFMQPRLIRLRDVADYLGMDINRFNREVRPLLIEIRIGKQGVAFDRLDLDAWVEQYKQRNECPVNKRKKLWDIKKFQDSKSVMESGSSIKKSLEDEFAKALEQVRWKKRKST
jgi:predicted DNA-binding transcriptional regulator AlpA